MISFVVSKWRSTGEVFPTTIIHSLLSSTVRLEVTKTTQLRYAKTVANMRAVHRIAFFLASLVLSREKFLALFFSDDPRVVNRKLPYHIKLALNGEGFCVDPARDSFVSCLEEQLEGESDDDFATA